MNAVAPSTSPGGIVAGSSLSLLDEKGILELLVAARGSSLKNKDKTRLRDLLLEYSAETSTSEREKLSSEINTILSAHAADFKSIIGRTEKTTTHKEIETQRSEPVTHFTASRPEPQFETASPLPAETEPASRKLTVNARSAEHQAATKEVKEESVTPTPTKTETAPNLPPHVNNPQARIDEIKRIVNSRVGNPINLIESNPDVGRGYMNALLNAMKKSSGGGLSGEVDVAMAALEQAFSEVEKIINTVPATPQKQSLEKEAIKTTPVKEIEKAAPSPQPSVAPIPRAEPQSQAKSVATVVPGQTETPKKTIRLSDLRPSPRPPKKETEGLYHLPENESPVRKEAEVTSSEKSVLGKLTSRIFAGGPKQAENKTVDQKAVTEKSELGVSEKMVAKTAPIAKEVKAPPAAPLHSVAAEATLPEKMDAFKKTLSEKDAAKMKPITGLDSPEVSEGLARLLSEWKLFKSSGFLGTGPAGHEHPLYKQLAGLAMASVIAGRFEGATPEIKQGITDYMNGWRYEQGILHEMGETFEHYLRRVILQILERQRQQKLVGGETNK